MISSSHLHTAVMHKELDNLQAAVIAKNIFGSIPVSSLRNNAQLFLKGLCEDWPTSGEWQGYRLTNGGFFLAPIRTDGSCFSLKHGANFIVDRVNSRLTGVIVFLYVYAHMSIDSNDFVNVWARQHELLQQYICCLPESERSIIYDAIN